MIKTHVIVFSSPRNSQLMRSIYSFYIVEDYVVYVCRMSIYYVGNMPSETLVKKVHILKCLIEQMSLSIASLSSWLWKHFTRMLQTIYSDSGPVVPLSPYFKGIKCSLQYSLCVLQRKDYTSEIFQKPCCKFVIQHY